jgi:hypothetical protein
MVSGNYQAGTWVLDITNPANAQVVAWTDPPPVPPPPGLGNPPIFCSNTGGCPLTGVWSSHWYNDLIYESHIGEGLNIYGLRGNAFKSSLKLDRLNPQTQEFSITGGKNDDDDSDSDSD